MVLGSDVSCFLIPTLGNSTQENDRASNTLSSQDGVLEQTSGSEQKLNPSETSFFKNQFISLKLFLRCWDRAKASCLTIMTCLTGY